MYDEDYVETKWWWAPPGEFTGRIGGTIGNVLDRHKPYVYRGTGEDQIEIAKWEAVERERERAERWERERKQEAERVREQRREQRRRAREREEIRRIPHLIAAMQRGIARAVEQDPDPEPVLEPARTVYVHKDGTIRRKRTPRAADGWQPSTGADLERWLTEMEDE